MGSVIDKFWQKFENNMLNEAVSDIRIRKLKVMYRLVKREVKKPVDKLKRKDIEEFLNKVNRNEIQKQKGGNLSGSTKADIKKFLKQLYKWHKGNNEIYPPEVAWIKTRIRKDELPEEKPVLNIQEAQKLAGTFKKIELRLLTLLLFDAGFRIQEMLSATKKDLTWEEYDSEGNKCFWINCNKSKTITRKVPVPLFTGDIEIFYNSLYYKDLKENEPLFSVSYNYYRQVLKKNSITLFGKDKAITPHALRHSSATYYAREYDGNMNMIAQRYGWSFSSDELKTYIRKSGAYQKAGAKKIFDNEVRSVQRENNKLKEIMKTMSKRIEGIEKLADFKTKKLAESLLSKNLGKKPSKIDLFNEIKKNPKLMEELILVSRLG